MKNFNQFTLAFLAFFISMQCIAQPTINNVNGAIQHGQSIQISGSDFGAKAVATPLIWDDFENGTLGGSVGNGWSKQRENETYPIYTDVQKYGRGDLSLTNHIEPNANNAPGCQFCGAYKVVPEGYELYTSYRFRLEVTGDNYAVIKLARLASTPNYGGTDYYNGAGTLKYQYQPAANWGYVNLEPSSVPDEIQATCTGTPAGDWHRVEMYYKMSQPAGAANGAAWIIINNETDSRFVRKDIVTLEEGYESKLHSLLLPLMGANPRNDGKFDLYVDDVYLDNSLARVEIGNASTWSASTRREIQIPSSWSSSAINVDVNLGAFDEEDEVYLYVVDKDGNVNENGYPIDIALAAVEEGDDVDLVTGTLEMPGSAEIAIFPNPAGNELVIQGFTAEGEIVVRNLSGKKVIGRKLIDSVDAHHLDIAKIPKGVYIVEIHTAKGKYSEKFVKR